jgi:hypothetical protein
VMSCLVVVVYDDRTVGNEIWGNGREVCGRWMRMEQVEGIS